MDQVTQDAIKLQRQLSEIASEFRMFSALAVTDVGSEIAKRNAKACDDAAAMLQKLGTEVTRLREGIGCYHYGRLDRQDLWRMARSWNGDSALTAGQQT